MFNDPVHELTSQFLDGIDIDCAIAFIKHHREGKQDGRGGQSDHNGCKRQRLHRGQNHRGVGRRVGVDRGDAAAAVA